jgi:hypothetical protein
MTCPKYRRAYHQTCVGAKYASEKNGTIILIKLIELVILCVKSGEFMVFPTMSSSIRVGKTKSNVLR